MNEKKESQMATLSRQKMYVFIVRKLSWGKMQVSVIRLYVEWSQKERPEHCTYYGEVAEYEAV